MDTKQTASGLFVVKAEPDTPRTATQLVAAGPVVFARANDGSIWNLRVTQGADGRPAFSWDRLPDLPNG